MESGQSLKIKRSVLELVQTKLEKKSIHCEGGGLRKGRAWERRAIGRGVNPGKPGMELGWLSLLGKILKVSRNKGEGGGRIRRNQPYKLHWWKGESGRQKKRGGKPKSDEKRLREDSLAMEGRLYSEGYSTT